MTSTFRSSNNTGLTDFEICVLYQHTQSNGLDIKLWLYGNILSGIVYGAIATLYFAYVQLMRRQYPKFDLFTRQAWILLGYATSIFVLCTLIFASSFQESAGLLSGPTCNEDGTWSDPTLGTSRRAVVMGSVCFLITSWTADILLIWRCLILYYGSGRTKWLVVAITFPLQICSFAIGGIFCSKLSSANRGDGANLGDGFNLGDGDIFRSSLMSYYEFITLAQNAVLTVLIISRLLLHRNRVRKTLGNDFGREYTNIAAMLIESQAMTLVAQSITLAFIHKTQLSVIYQILAQIQALAPLLIMYRVLQGKAWSSNTFAEMTKLKFSKSTDAC